MVQPNTTEDLAPALPASQEELVRGYLTYLSQTSLLPPLPAAPPPSLTSAVAVPMPTPATQGCSFNWATQGCSFNWASHGTGGALKAKQLTSQQITTPAVKQKALVNPNTGPLLLRF